MAVPAKMPIADTVKAEPLLMVNGTVSAATTPEPTTAMKPDPMRVPNSLLSGDPSHCEVSQSGNCVCILLRMNGYYEFWCYHDNLHSCVIVSPFILEYVIILD